MHKNRISESVEICKFMFTFNNILTGVGSHPCKIKALLKCGQTISESAAQKARRGGAKCTAASAVLL